MDRQAVDTNVLVLTKGEETYFFLWHDEYRDEVLKSIGRHAANPELSFSWYDAAQLAYKVKQMSRNNS